MAECSGQRCGPRRGATGETDAVGAEFELHVDVPGVFEAVLERDDVGVLHRLVNLDLAKELGDGRSCVVSLRAWRIDRLSSYLCRRERTHLALVLGRLELLLGNDFDRLLRSAGLCRKVHPREPSLRARKS